MAIISMSVNRWMNSCNVTVETSYPYEDFGNIQFDINNIEYDDTGYRIQEYDSWITSTTNLFALLGFINREVTINELNIEDMYFDCPIEEINFNMLKAQIDEEILKHD